MKWLIGIMVLFLSLPAIPQTVQAGTVRIVIVGCAMGSWSYNAPSATLTYTCLHKVLP